MLTLAMDTATRVCSVSLVQDQKVLANYEINMGMTHSEGLMPQIDQLFARTGITKEQIDRIAVSMGPGSFTGLRIGLASAEAMAYSWGCGLCGVNTLKALAYNLPVEGPVLAPVLDAQKGNYYVALYTWHAGSLQELLPITIMNPEELWAKLGEYKAPKILLGETAKLARLQLPTGVTVAPEQLVLPKASSVALAAGDDPGLKGEEFFGLEPYYIRRSEAEELWEQRQAGK